MATNDYNAMASSYRAGATLAEISRQHHCSRNSVRRALVSAGCALRIYQNPTTVPEPIIVGVHRIDLDASAELLKIRRAAK